MGQEENVAIDDGSAETDIATEDEFADTDLAPDTPADTTTVDTPAESTETTESAPPQLTPEEALAKVAEYEAQLKTFEPYKVVDQEYGGLAGLRPAMVLTDAILQGDAKKFVEGIDLVNPGAKHDIFWGLANENKDLLIHDAEYRQAVLASEPEYQQFLQLKAQGVEFKAEEEQLDPENPLHAEILQARKEREEMQKFRQEQEAQKVEAEKIRLAGIEQNFKEKHLFNFINEKVGQLNFGEDGKHLNPLIAHMACVSFDSDKKAVAASARAMNLAKMGAPQSQIDAAAKVAQNYLAQHIEKVSKPFNALNKAAVQGKQAVRSQQESRSRVIPGSAAGAPATVLSGLANANDPYTKAQALLDRARTQGKVNGYQGY